jgi:hypothetical protein
MLGITLIRVPYWWDRKSESLASTIYVQRPDLITAKPTESSPIPSSAPKIEQQNPTESKIHM